MLAKMLDSEPDPARTGGAQHQPVRPLRKVFLWQAFAEHFVIDAEILNGHAALRYPGRAAGFENVDRPTGEALGHPTAKRASSEPFVLERR